MFLLSPGIHTCSQTLSPPPPPWLWPHPWTSSEFPIWQFYLQTTEFSIFFLDQNFLWHPKVEHSSFLMPITAFKPSAQILIKETRRLIFKKHDSVFSKRLTLSWGTSIVIFWLNHSTSISGFIFHFGFKVLCQIGNRTKGGSLFCCSFLFLSLPSPNKRYSVPFSKWGSWIPVCSWGLQVEINMPKDIFTWRLTPRKHSVSGKKSSMCLFQKTSLHASVAFLCWGLKDIILKKFLCSYLSHFPNWQKIFAISVCIAVHSRLSWILSEEFFLPKAAQISFIQAHWYGHSSGKTLFKLLI